MSDHQQPMQGKVALVTGAARGIGRAIALQLAADGAHVVALDLPGAPMAQLLDEVRAAGVQALAVEADVTVAADWERTVGQTVEMFGALDILVNNAGIGGPLSPLVDYPEDSFDQVMAVNARGVFLGTKYAARAMKNRGGAIVNVASVSGLSGSRFILAYTASKHAVIGITKVAALELAPYGIRVNAVCPAPTATDMIFGLERTLAPEHPEAAREQLTKGIPLGRYGEPAEIAAVTAFLCGPNASFMSGAAVTVDGGMLAS